MITCRVSDLKLELMPLNCIELILVTVYKKIQCNTVKRITNRVRNVLSAAYIMLKKKGALTLIEKNVFK